MAWSNIPDAEIAIDAPVLSSTMVKLRDNVAQHTHISGQGGTPLGVNSVAEGSIQNGAVTNLKLGALAVTDAKVNDIDGSKIANTSVGSGKLKTALGTSGAIPLNVGAWANIQLNLLSFFPLIEVNPASDAVLSPWHGTGVLPGVFSVINLAPVGGTVVNTGLLVSWYYLTASDNPQVWAIVSDNEEVIGYWVSQDPVNPREKESENLIPISIFNPDGTPAGRPIKIKLSEELKNQIKNGDVRNPFDKYRVNFNAKPAKPDHLKPEIEFRELKEK